MEHAEKYQPPRLVFERPARKPKRRKATRSDTARQALRRVMTVAWLSILLGLAMQGLVLFSKVYLGGWPPSARIVLDLVQGVTWSFFVCAGVGLGTTIAKSKAAIGGLISMIAAPAAMGIAKGTQKLVGDLLEATQSPVIISMTSLGIVRAIEYGVLGWLLAWMVAKDEDRWHRFLAAGASVGIVIGGGVTFATAKLAAMKGIALTPQQIVATGLNEILFPIGCSLVVFVALMIGRQLKIVTSGAIQPA